jgi:hypothetical protein
MRAVFSVIVNVALLMVAAPALPHHSFAAVFDINRPIEFTGTVTRLEWTNPHAWIHLDVEDSDGNLHSWSVELLGINTLLKQGWTPDVLEPGDVIHVEGFGARDGSTSGNGSVITMLDTGEQLWVSETREAI